MASFKNLVSTTSAQISSGGTITGDLVINGDLQVDGGGSLSFDEIIEGTQVVDVTNTEALLVRKNSDGGDVFIVDTTNTRVGVGNTPEVNFHIKLADTANARIEDTSSDGIAKLDFKNDARTATIGVYGDDSDNFKIDHGGGTVITIDVGQVTTFSNDVKISKASGSTTQSFVPANGQSSQIKFFQDDGTTQDARIFAPEGAQDLAFEAGTTEMMRITTTGVGIGTSAPASAAGANALDIVDTNTSSSSQGASLRLGSNDGGAMGDDHRLGVISFRGSEDGAGTMTEGARIDAICDAGWSATENGASLRFFTTDGNASETQRLVIDSDGQSAFTGVITTTEDIIVNSDAGKTVIGKSGSNAVIDMNNDSPAHKVRIHAGGNSFLDGGSLAIGHQSPSFKLDVSGDMRVEQTADATIATFIGSDGNNATIEIHADDGDDNADQWRINANTAGKLSIGNYSTGAWVNHITLDANSRFSMSNNGGEPTNTIFGYQAGNSIHGSSGMNTFFGHQVADATMTAAADENTAVGHLALSGLTSGAKNIAIGSYSGINITSGDENVLIGRSAGNAFNSSDLVAVGTATLASIDSADADGSTAVGYNALTALTSGRQSTGVGYKSLNAVTDGDNNTAFGYEAGLKIAGGSNNAVFGSEALKNEDGHGKNTAIGTQTLFTLNAGADGHNTALGYQAGSSMNTGTSNTVIGSLTGDAITSGTNNVVVGKGSDISAVDGTNQIVLGQGATGVGNNWATIGNASIANVAMNQNGSAIVHAAGIFFPATQVANGDANVLDDYEEGTWTPTLTTTGTDFDSVSYNADTGGLYTKIGRVIHLQGCIRTSALTAGSASGNVKIGGLPFTPANHTTEGDAGFFISFASGFAGETPIIAHAERNNTNLILYFRTTADDPVSALQVADVDGSITFNFHGSFVDV